MLTTNPPNRIIGIRVIGSKLTAALESRANTPKNSPKKCPWIAISKNIKALLFNVYRKESGVRRKDRLQSKRQELCHWEEQVSRTLKIMPEVEQRNRQRSNRDQPRPIWWQAIFRLELLQDRSTYESGIEDIHGKYEVYSHEKESYKLQEVGFFIYFRNLFSYFIVDQPQK